MVPLQLAEESLSNKLKELSEDFVNLVFSGIALGFADETSEVNELRSERGPLEDWATFFPGDWDTPAAGHAAGAGPRL